MFNPWPLSDTRNSQQLLVNYRSIFISSTYKLGACHKYTEHTRDVRVLITIIVVYASSSKANQRIKKEHVRRRQMGLT